MIFPDRGVFATTSPNKNLNIQSYLLKFGVFGYVSGVQTPNLRRCFQEAIWIRSPLQGQGLIESTPGAVQVSAVFVLQSSLWMVHDSDEVTHKLLNMRLFWL